MQVREASMHSVRLARKQTRTEACKDGGELASNEFGNHTKQETKHARMQALLQQGRKPTNIRGKHAMISARSQASKLASKQKQPQEDGYRYKSLNPGGKQASLR